MNEYLKNSNGLFEDSQGELHEGKMYAILADRYYAIKRQLKRIDYKYALTTHEDIAEHLEDLCVALGIHANFDKLIEQWNDKEIKYIETMDRPTSSD